MRAKFGRGPTVVSKKGSLKFISRLNLNLIRILFYRSTLVGYDLSAFYMFLPMFYMFHLYFVIHLFEHFNVIALFKLNNIIIIYYYHYICAQSGKNCLQSYNELCVCSNLMRNTHSIGNTYFS